MPNGRASANPLLFPLRCLVLQTATEAKEGLCAGNGPWQAGSAAPRGRKKTVDCEKARRWQRTKRHRGKVAAYDRTEDAWKDCAGSSAEAQNLATSTGELAGTATPAEMSTAMGGEEGDERLRPLVPGAAAAEDEFEADEEAAMAMGNYASFNVNNDAEAKGAQAANKRKGETQGGGEVVSIGTRRTRAREATKEAEKVSERMATKRAIESITAGLRAGPRDSADRLRALRQRILDKQAANRAELEGKEADMGDEAATEGPTRDSKTYSGSTKRAPPEEPRHVIRQTATHSAPRRGEGGAVSSVKVDDQEAEQRAPKTEYGARDPTASSSSLPWTGRLAVRISHATNVTRKGDADGNLCESNYQGGEGGAEAHPLVAEIKRRRRSCGHGRDDPPSGETVDNARRRGIG